MPGAAHFPFFFFILPCSNQKAHSGIVWSQSSPFLQARAPSPGNDGFPWRQNGHQQGWGLPNQAPRLWCRVPACSVMPDYLRPHGLQPVRLLYLRGSPGNNAGECCHALLQGASSPRDWTHLSCVSHLGSPSPFIITPKPRSLLCHFVSILEDNQIYQPGKVVWERDI